jgi:hypothetical protein
MWGTDWPGHRPPRMVGGRAHRVGSCPACVSADSPWPKYSSSWRSRPSSAVSPCRPSATPSRAIACAPRPTTCSRPSRTRAAWRYGAIVGPLSAPAATAGPARGRPTGAAGGLAGLARERPSSHHRRLWTANSPHCTVPAATGSISPETARLPARTRPSSSACEAAPPPPSPSSSGTPAGPTGNRQRRTMRRSAPGPLRERVDGA